MISINFRKDTLDGLVGQNKRFAVADGKTPGLCLLVYPSGAKTFALYRKVKGKPQRIKIGRYSHLTIENARKEATRLNALIALGGDPYEERKAARQEITFNELYGHYHTEYSMPFNKKNSDEDRRMLERHFLHLYGDYKVSAISSEIMRRLHVQIGKEYKSIANRVVAMVSAIINFGKPEYYDGPNPCSGITKFKEKSRDRFLNPEELTSFFNALQVETDLYQDYFLLLLFTGVRKSNQLSMRWSAIEMNLTRWRIAENNTKNSDVNFIYLPKPAVEILKRRKDENKKSETPSLFVFPGKGKTGHLKDPKKSFNRIRKRMNIYDIRIHDLRRTLGSYMAISGASLPIIGKALNHKSQDSTAIYARLSQDPVHNAVNKAVNMMIENNVFSLFRANLELLILTSTSEAIKFSELMAA